MEALSAMNSVAGVDLSLAAQGQQPSGWMQILPLVLIMVIFYVLLILPAQRRQKKTNEMLAALKSGDKVVTNGGIYGTIVGLDNEAVQLRIADQVRIKVARAAIAQVLPDSKDSAAG
jgi:preprotein translocase subunit YajC